jgi:hypothetical protein
MNDEFTRRAKAQIEGLRKDITETETVIQRAEAARARLREELAIYEQALAVYGQVMNLPTEPDGHLPLAATLRGSIADMCAQIIGAYGHPIPIKELVRLLVEVGKFKNPKNYRGNYGTVFGTLQRDERFRKLPGKGTFTLAPNATERHGPLFSQLSGEQASDLERSETPGR